jgi:hypothetical protein
LLPAGRRKKRQDRSRAALEAAGLLVADPSALAEGDVAAEEEAVEDEEAAQEEEAVAPAAGSTSKGRFELFQEGVRLLGELLPQAYKPAAAKLAAISDSQLPKFGKTHTPKRLLR